MRKSSAAWIPAIAMLACVACGPQDDPAEGNLAVGAVIGEHPVLQEVRIDPGAFITLCDAATLEAIASDNALDPLTFTWTVADAPAGASAAVVEQTATDTSSTALFSTDEVGPHDLVVSADDGVHAPASLPIRVHVSPCP